MKRVTALTVAAAMLSALSGSAQFRKPRDAVEYREVVMSAIGTHFSPIGAVVQGKAPFDSAANAHIVGVMSTPPFPAFVDGTASKDRGGAKASIWTERAKFDADAKTMQQAVVPLEAATKTQGPRADQGRGRPGRQGLQIVPRRFPQPVAAGGGKPRTQAIGATGARRGPITG